MKLDLNVPQDTLSINDSIFLNTRTTDFLIDEAIIPVLNTKQFISPGLFSDSLHSNLKVNYSHPLPFYYFDSEHYTASPFSYSFYNWREGGDIVGINNSFKISDYLHTNLSFSISSAYVGYLQPDRYNNASVSLYTTLQPHDRVYLTLYGQASLREGINPQLEPAINGGNYYGIELRFKIYKNIGLGIGFRNSYYRNHWNSFKYMSPAFF
ncbi:MAG: hypothetical protein LBP83_09280 [Dysgonamonadaceae bacterium]|nr:hypothetical protein [Dysgonamonadaceae bacterium]